MEGPEDEQVSGQHPVEEDWNRAPEPALLGSPTHPPHITNEHDAGVDNTEPDHARPELWPRIGPCAMTSREVDVDPRQQADDGKLYGQQQCIGCQRPVLVWGEPGGPSRPHQQLTDNTEDEERGQHGEAQRSVDGLRRVGSRFRVDDDRARGNGECDHKHDLGWNGVGSSPTSRATELLPTVTESRTRNRIRLARAFSAMPLARPC